MLKLNSDKTEIMVMGKKSVRAKFCIPSINVAGVDVKVTDQTVSNLGVDLDPGLSLKSQINRIVSSANYYLRNIYRIRNCLGPQAIRSAVVSLVLSRLDYCNALLSGLPARLLNKLQLVQNSVARVISNVSIREHIQPVLYELHWLPIVKRITYKVLLLTYKALNGLSPEYLTELLEYYTPPPGLRSAEDRTSLIVKKYVGKRTGARAFSFYAPPLWNALPMDIRETPTLTGFKSKLKTFLFVRAFY